MAQKQGAIVIAIDKPAYAYMAHALACALSITRNGIPTTLVTDAVCADALGPERLKDFDIVTYLKQEHLYHKGKKQIDRAKLFLPLYSPYEVTAALDADCCWFLGANTECLFTAPRHNGLAMMAIAHWNKPTDGYWGMTLNQIKERYPDIGTLAWLCGTLMVYDTAEALNTTFPAARELYAEIEALNPTSTWWLDNTQYPIELPLSILQARGGLTPPIWIPLATNSQVNKGLRERWQLIQAGYSGLTIWGKSSGQATEYLYYEWHRELQALLPQVHDYVPKEE